MSSPSDHMPPWAMADCRVCGERVALIEAPLHAEDHAQRGEYPPDYREEWR